LVELNFAAADLDIRGDYPAQGELHHIAWDEFGGRDRFPMPIALDERETSATERWRMTTDEPTECANCG
jgi:hypothetical protein